MNYETRLLTALTVVEWHGALQQLQLVRSQGGDVDDLLIDVLTFELADQVLAWCRGRTTMLTFDEAEVECRAFLTENVQDLDALLGVQAEPLVSD